MHPINHEIVIKGRGVTCFLIRFALISRMVQLSSKIAEKLKRLKEAQICFRVGNLAQLV